MATIPKTDALLQKLAAAPWEASLALFAELIKDNPGQTWLPALALRERARAGELPSEAVPLLVIALVDAPSDESVRHLAKALAAFGHAATAATPYLWDRIRGLPVTDDESFWTLDSCIHALGFVAGEDALALLDELARKSPSPVLKSRKVYKGKLSDADRTEIFGSTLQTVRAVAVDGKSAGWRGKVTQRKATAGAAAGKTAPWMTR